MVKIEASKRLKETAGWFYATTDAEVEEYLEENPNNVECGLVEAGWFDSMSDIAKKAYLKLHPGSKAGKGSAPSKPASKPSGGPDNLKKQHEEAKKHAQALHKKMSGGGTDAEWAAYDAAQAKLAKLTKQLKNRG